MTHIPFVYGLYDPADAGHIRYVGMAPTNPSRPYRHAVNAREKKDADSYLMRWICKIQAEGREPAVTILETLNETTGRAFLGFVESCYIKSLRAIGHQLTNANDGGWGGSNGPHTPEARLKMKLGWTPEVRAISGAKSRKRFSGKQRSVESRLKQSETRTGMKFSDEHRANLQAARKAAWDQATPEQRAHHAAKTSAAKMGVAGHVQTEETKNKIRAKLIGRVQSNEWREKNAVAQRGKRASDDTRAKQSAAHKAAWARRKAKKEFNDDRRKEGSGSVEN